MKKQEKFTKLLKKNRKMLLEAGISPTTISMYLHNNRIPRTDFAEKIALILDIPIDSIPARKTIIV
jgi:transcriptional regulator with XRE-family HTH domain